MTRRGVSDGKLEASARQASQRMIARGERPAYRLRMGQDGRWTVVEAPWLHLTAGDRRALPGALQVIAEWLDSDPTAFDLEVAEPP